MDWAMGTFSGSTPRGLICLRKRHWEHTIGQETHDTVSKTKATMRTTKKNGTSNIPTLEAGSSFNTLESKIVVELSTVEAWDVSGTPIRQNNKNTIKPKQVYIKLPSDNLFRSSSNTLESVVVVEMSTEAGDISGTPISKIKLYNKLSLAGVNPCQLPPTR